MQHYLKPFLSDTDERSEKKDNGRDGGGYFTAICPVVIFIAEFFDRIKRIVTGMQVL